MGQKIVRQLPYLFFVLLILWLIYWAPKSIGMFGGNDNFAHFMLARYAWNYPELFLRLWGRPAYTFFFSLPACGGIEGLKVTNTILFGVVALLTSDSARRLNMPHTGWLTIFTLSVPLLIRMSISGMTEMLMALVVIGTLNLYLRHKWTAAAILISFSPFTRPEGWLFIAAFGGLYLLQKKWRPLSFLLLAPFLMSMIGWPVYGSPLWIFEKNPYPLESPYGSGSFWTFIRALPRSLNFFVLIGFIFGHFFLFWKRTPKEIAERAALIAFPFWGFVLVHSYFWYKGILGSMGLVRVMASVAPLAMLMAWSGWTSITARIPRIGQVAFLGILALLSVHQVWKNYQFPKPEDPFVQMGEVVGHWFVESPYVESTLYCDNAILQYFSKRDPFSDDVQRYFPIKRFPNLPENANGAVILWDSRIMRQRISLDQLMQSDAFELIHRFTPDPKFEEEYERVMDVYVFIKRPPAGGIPNTELVDQPDRNTIWKP